MANKSHIKFYKGVVLVKIKAKLLEDGVDLTTEQVDTTLKEFAKIDMSTIEMTQDQLKDLIEKSKEFGMRIGLDLDKGNGIELNFK